VIRFAIVEVDLLQASPKCDVLFKGRQSALDVPDPTLVLERVVDQPACVSPGAHCVAEIGRYALNGAAIKPSVALE
jgi:hypothetical protein